MNVQQLFDDALVEIGIQAESTNVSGDRLTRMYRRANDLMHSWEALGLKGWTRATGSFSLVASTASYTCGAGGTGLSLRPSEIFLIYARDPSGVDYPPMTRLTPEEYASLPNKTDTGDPPDRWVYNDARGTSTLTFYLVPASSGWTVFVDYRKPFTDFSAVSDIVDVPPPWQRAFVKQLAIEMAPTFGRKAPQELITQAAEALTLAIGDNREIPNQPLFGWADEW